MKATESGRQVVVEQRRVLVLEAAEAVEVEMGDGDPALA